MVDGIELYISVMLCGRMEISREFQLHIYLKHVSVLVYLIETKPIGCRPYWPVFSYPFILLHLFLMSLRSSIWILLDYLAFAFCHVGNGAKYWHFLSFSFHRKCKVTLCHKGILY